MFLLKSVEVTTSLLKWLSTVGTIVSTSLNQEEILGLLSHEFISIRWLGHNVTQLLSIFGYYTVTDLLQMVWKQISTILLKYVEVTTPSTWVLIVEMRHADRLLSKWYISSAYWSINLDCVRQLNRPHCVMACRGSQTRKNENNSSWHHSTIRCGLID